MPCVVDTRLWIRSNFGGRPPASLGLFMQDVKVVISESHACTVVSYRANNIQYVSSGINSLKSVLIALSVMTRFGLATCVGY